MEMVDTCSDGCAEGPVEAVEVRMKIGRGCSGRGSVVQWRLLEATEEASRLLHWRLVGGVFGSWWGVQLKLLNGAVKVE